MKAEKQHQYKKGKQSTWETTATQKNENFYSKH